VQSLAVDFGNTMLFGALATGGCLHLADPAAATDPDALDEFVAGVDYLKMVPSHLAALGSVARPAKALVLGGEASPVGWARELLAGGTVCNHYGPTETTVGVAADRLTEEILAGAWTTAPVGRPLAGARLHVLDRSLGLVPSGVAGELYVGGSTLARGYVGQAALTAERFVADPVGGDGGRVYRTGDRTRWRPDGRIEFLGRLDDQLKVRGYRVEPGEVEAALSTHPSVGVASVVTRGDHGDRRLVAYVTPADGVAGVAPAEQLRDHLSARLPGPMVPGTFVELAKLPLAPNGKVDRAALPAPERPRAEATGGFLASLTPTEQALADVWAEVLGLDQVHAADDFFDLGGHSLLATRTVALARAAGYDLSVTDLYNAPTLAGLARRAGSQRGAVTSGARSCIKIRRGDVRPPVFCVHEVGGGASDFHELAGWLEPGHQLYGLQARGLFDDTRPLRTVQQMAAAYLEEILEIQPDGPYLFAGLSMGSYVALEMAYQVEARGRRVGSVVMLGAPTPVPGIRGGQPLDYEVRRSLPALLDAAITGPPGTLLPGSYVDWFVSEWTVSADEEARLRAGDKQTLRMMRVVELNRAASMRYQGTIDRRHRTRFAHRPRPYRGRVVLILPEQADPGDVDTAISTWRSVLRMDPEVRTAPGNHYSIITGAGAEAMGRHLAAEIERLATDG